MFTVCARMNGQTDDALYITHLHQIIGGSQVPRHVLAEFVIETSERKLIATEPEWSLHCQQT